MLTLLRLPTDPVSRLANGLRFRSRPYALFFFFSGPAAPCRQGQACSALRAAYDGQPPLIAAWLAGLQDANPSLDVPVLNLSIFAHHQQRNPHLLKSTARFLEQRAIAWEVRKRDRDGRLGMLGL